MSKKDFDKEFEQIEAQYFSMIESLRVMQAELQNELVSPEMYENMQKMAEPLIDNYRKWNYIKFILNKPTRKQKAGRYKNQNKKLMKNMTSFDDMYQENEIALNSINNFSYDDDEEE